MSHAILSYEKIEKMMHPQIKEIIEKWDNDGIIIEGEFQFSYQFLLKYYVDTAYEIICKNGGHVIDCESIEEYEPTPITGAVETPQGWMYFFFDSNYMDYKSAKKAVKKHFK